MNDNAVETTGETIEEAVARGLEMLNASPTQVIIEVLEEPSKGVFGLGGRPAKVRVQLMGGSLPPMPPVSAPVEQDTVIEIPRPDTEWTPPPSTPESRERRTPREGGERREGRQSRESGTAREEQPRRERPPRNRSKSREREQDYGIDVSDDDSGSPFLSEAAEVPEHEQDDEAQIAKVVLAQLLEHLDMRATIIVRRAEPGEQGGSSPWILDVSGGNLNRLIGRRGETLASLQYITRLITSRELQRRAEVIIDVAGYKSRRAASLHALALRMADEAIERGRTVTLEPMPPHERRIVHLALRERADVVTRSVGEGESRKVTIVPSSEA